MVKKHLIYYLSFKQYNNIKLNSNQEKIALARRLGYSLNLTAATMFRTRRLHALKFGIFIALECTDSTSLLLLRGSSFSMLSLS